MPLGAAGKKGLLAIVGAIHAGMSTADVEQIVTNWPQTARHPRFDRPHIDLACQPLVVLLDDLRANAFMTHIVSHVVGMKADRSTIFAPKGA